MTYQPRVLVSQVIPESADDVWETVRDFGSIDEWHPVITDCTLEGDQSGDQIGSVRDFQAGEKTVRERLVAHSDAERFYQYTILEGGGAKINYHSELRLIPITESDRTLAKWVGYFDVEDGSMDDAKENLTPVFTGGLNNLKEHFS